MRCLRCDTELPEHSAFCSECGAPVRPAESSLRAEESYPILARANLLRMRGQWAEAASLCMRVLQGDPRNASAHSLLGDIYENQGRIEDAIEWYRRALALSPGNEADAAKLARAQELLEARRQRAEWQAVIEGRDQPLLARSAMRESAQNVVMVVGAAVIGIVAAMAVITSATARFTPAHAGSELPPPSRVGRRAGSALHTDREEALLRHLNAQHAATRQVMPGAVFLHPRDQRAEVYLAAGADLMRSAPLDTLRSIFLAEAYNVAYTAAWWDPMLRTVRIYVTGPLPATAGGGPRERLFAGEFAREQLLVEPEKVRLEPSPDNFYRSRIHDLWWHPALAP